MSKESFYEFAKRRVAGIQKYLDGNVQNYQRHLETRNLDSQRDELQQIESNSNELLAILDLITSYDVYLEVQK